MHKNIFVLLSMSSYIYTTSYTWSNFYFFNFLIYSCGLQICCKLTLFHSVNIYLSPMNLYESDQVYNQFHLVRIIFVLFMESKLITDVKAGDKFDSLYFSKLGRLDWIFLMNVIRVYVYFNYFTF